MSETIPLSYLRHHVPNITGMFGQGLRSALPLPRRAVETPTPPIRKTLPAVPRHLVEAYADWTGAPRERYAETLPPHMFSYWGMGLIAKLTGLAPYNLLTVLNQGCRVQTHQALPIGEAIEVSGYLAEVREDSRKVRITTHLDAHTASAPQGQSMDVMAAVPRKGVKKAASQADAAGPEYETVGSWSAGADAGLQFALLTGDFNPIHTFWPLARRTRYGGCILHGFGFLSRSYETIQNAGFVIADFDVRYVKPLALPAHDLEVQISREPLENGWRALRLRSPNGDIHLAGQFSEAPA